ncbi:MAG: Fe-S cluster protein, partial [Proteobacteria bacterium]|nr:Fe-S cluster protein [Pseudomonadota bacterium]
MPEFANAMEVFKLLDKSNCRKCNEQTCLAFASKVFLGQRPLEECPALTREVLEKHSKKQKKKINREEYRETLLADAKKQIKFLDLESAAQRVGGVFSKGMLTLRIFGKQFSID